MRRIGYLGFEFMVGPVFEISNFYSLLGLSTRKHLKCYPTMTKGWDGQLVLAESMLLSGITTVVRKWTKS